ncbi:MAG TPA: hypothetical protein VHW46_00005 [Terracidiphilus sp.]|nr:hypothetical protein [Terracidiphilus sp.]
MRTLVPYEPPCVELLPDAEQHRASGRELDEFYKAHGAQAAMQKFMASACLNMLPKDGPLPPPEVQEAFGRKMSNLDFFFCHEMRAIVDYVPNVATLKQGGPRIVVGVGEMTIGQIANHAGIALARRLGTRPVIFRGDHGGYSNHPPPSQNGWIRYSRLIHSQGRLRWRGSESFASSITPSDLV